MPTTVPMRLKVPPRLASWNAQGDPEQQRLKSYVDYVIARVEESLARQPGDVAVRLDVSVPEQLHLLDQRDLDNYLFPLATRLHSDGFPITSWWATKSRQVPSLVRVGASESTTVDDVLAEFVTTASSESAKYKEDIRDKVSSVEPLPDGPAAVQIAFVTGPGRNWLNLWKPTIDALGSLLGLTDPARPWHPRDGRITQLGLHHRLDPGLRHDVRIAISAQPATTTADRQDQDAHRSGGPVDDVFDVVRRDRPDIGIERRQVEHPADADELWYFRTSSGAEVQVESGPDGQRPFVVEGVGEGQRLRTEDPGEAAAAVLRWLQLKR